MTVEMKVPAEASYSPMVTEEMIDGRDWGRGALPVYRVAEVAKFFFGMSESWLRLKLRADEDHPDTWFVYQGKRMDIRRKKPDKDDSERVFTLADIELMALSLRRFGAISPIRFAQILRIVEAEAYLYGLLVPSPAAEGEDPE